MVSILDELRIAFEGIPQPSSMDLTGIEIDWSQEGLLDLSCHFIGLRRHIVHWLLPKVLQSIAAEPRRPIRDPYSPKMLLVYLDASSGGDLELSAAKHETLDLLTTRQARAVLSWLELAKDQWTALREIPFANVESLYAEASRRTGVATPASFVTFARECTGQKFHSFDNFAGLFDSAANYWRHRLEELRGQNSVEVNQKP